MATTEQKKILKAKIAVALHDELGRVPKKEEIENVFLMARVMYKAVLGLHFQRRQQKKNGQLPLYVNRLRPCLNIKTFHLQKDALQKAGCDKIFTDIASGAKQERIGLDEALNYVRPGDTLVVWRLDQLGRSLPHLIETITGLHNRIGFKSITESVDTTTSGGKLAFHIFGALAEFERDIIERTHAGLTAARARGRTRRPAKGTHPEKSTDGKGVI